MKKQFKKKPFRDWLDALARVVVKERDDWTCQGPNCGKAVSGLDAQWCHIISRTSNQTRWSLFNALCLCASCHGKAHTDQNGFQVWFNLKYPAWEMELIRLRQIPKHPWKEDDFRAVEKKLLSKAVDLEIEPYQIGSRYEKIFKRGMEQLLKKT